MSTLLSFVTDHILSSLDATVNQCRGRSTRLTGWIADGTTRSVSFENGALESVSVSAVAEDDCVLLSLDARACLLRGYPTAFTPEAALTIPLGPDAPDAILASAHYGNWWMRPAFPASYSAISPRTQGLLLRFGDRHIHLLPLCGENFRCEFSAGRLEITSDTAGLIRLSGPFLSVAVADDPTAAVEKNFAFARRTGGLLVPLREERELPALFESFGWCTWDAFYKEVSAEKIIAKLDEFKAKQIPVKWVLIDDGWFLSRERLITGFGVQPDKFPEGLGALVKRMKSDYGIEQVGVWHAFNGYWMGVDKESPLYEAQKDNLIITPAGLAIQSMDEERAFAFWDAFYTYLRGEGIDFVKVDNQSSESAWLNGVLPTAEGCRHAHNALERAVNKYFGGAIINCMGMDMENVLARPSTGLSRNSGDFYPETQRGFIMHLMHNVYNALWHGEIYYCDFDMWWSNHHESAAQSGVLRAISGSPIYVSDRIGDSNRDFILPTVADDGALMRCPQACRPTTDCIYTDCAAAGKLMKVWNRAGENYAVAAFQVSEEPVTEAVRLGDIPGLPAGEYVAYEYFTKTTVRVPSDGALPEVTLGLDGVAVWSLYPVKRDAEGEYAMMGDRSKYVPIAGALTRTRL